MSKAKRYAWKVNEENDFDLIEHSNGEFIRYEDYDRLKADSDQMATILSDLLQSDLIACSISRGVIKSTLAKWNAAPK